MPSRFTPSRLREYFIHDIKVYINKDEDETKQHQRQ